MLWSSSSKTVVFTNDHYCVHMGVVQTSIHRRFCTKKNEKKVSLLIKDKLNIILDRESWASTNRSTFC